MTTAVAGSRRFTRAHPCPICGGHAGLARHRGIRCWGFLGYEGLFAHCTRRPEVEWHLLAGRCKCGAIHGNAPAPVPTAAPRDAEDRTRGALRIWDRARVAQDSPTDAYLRARGIDLQVPPVLRHATSLRHAPSDSEWPAMVAAVRIVGRPGITGVHRTYLQPDGSGKAPVLPDKMMLGDCLGGSVQLASAEPELAVTEGIETGLSVAQMTGRATWAAMSEGGIVRLVLPPLPLAADVLIAADGDPAGRNAAFAAAERWRSEGRVVRIKEAPTGRDWNDVLRGLA